jgi:hypothetical protein
VTVLGRLLGQLHRVDRVIDVNDVTIAERLRHALVLSRIPVVRSLPCRPRDHSKRLAAVLCWVYGAGVPPDLGQYVGQAAFEQARGVVMEVCGYTADQALTALSEFVLKTGNTVEEAVSGLRRLPMIYGPLVCR